ncbi:MAG TPA: MBL fold metallo-hydrolase [Ramlibacter sp.]|nr:MBL fold metallo-hydrolase [Ramlibacter sp.]
MKTSRSLLPVVAAVLLAAIPLARGQAPMRPTQAQVDAHVAEATRLAGTDLKALLGLCNPPAATRPPQDVVDRSIATQIARPPPEPGKAFDNLYYVGAAWASAWAIDTAEGVILIDALNNPLEAGSLIEGGMRKFSLDPQQIKYIVITHGHGDHYGGANYLVERHKSRVVMSEADWKMTSGKLEFASVHWGAPPKRDLGVKDRDWIALGGTRVTFYETPGHTLGTISPVFEVKDGARTHRAMLWGGTAFNFGKDFERLDKYIAATKRMVEIAQQQQVDVLISNHPGLDGTIDKLEALRKRGAADAHPFVMGTPNVVRALTVMGTCAQATRDRYGMS